MKTYNYFLISLVVFASACSSTNQSVKNNTDDIYYSSKDAQKEIDDKKAAQLAAAEANRIKKANAENYSKASDNESTSEKTTPQTSDDYYDPNAKPTSTTSTTEGGNTYITNNYNSDAFDYDDYYDYAYSSRIRRFHNASYFGYYDPFYTDAYYYNYQPSCWGTSIYSSYNFWSPTTTIVIGSSWGYNPWRPYHYYGYSSWGYNPWMGYGYNSYGYGGYWNGYNNGYANGYWDGYNQGFNNGFYGNNYYYYNSYEHKNTYYGPRNGTASNGTGMHGRGGDSFGDKFERAVTVDRGRDINTIKNAEDSGRPKREDATIGTNNSTGRPVDTTPKSSGNATPAKGTVENENTGKPTYSNPKGAVNETPVKGKTTETETNGRPNNWTTKDESFPVKGKTNESENGTNGRPTHSETTQPANNNTNGGVRPNGNWNNSNTPKTNANQEPVYDNGGNSGRPRNNGANGNNNQEPAKPTYETPRSNPANGTRPNNEIKRNEEPPRIVVPQNQNEGRPKRNVFEGTPRQETQPAPRQEQRPVYEQPRQEAPRMQQNNSAPAQREGNSNGGGRRR